MLSTAEHDFGPLCSFIETQFGEMSRGIQRDAEIAIVMTQLIEVATRAVLDCAYAWNDQFATIRLPDELLAGCFAFLPLRDRLAASQVSRTWRRAALSFPSVWSQLEVLSHARGFASLFNLALARTGNIPVDMECKWSGFWFPGHGEQPEQIGEAVNRHCHHLRSLRWYMSHPLPGFLSTAAAPAPLLESLEIEGDLELSRDFLGGSTSRLLSLHVEELVLPASCPAISRLTHLHCDIPDRPDAAWRRLFDLCPRLESLTLCKLPSEMPQFLPPGPAPRTLVRLKFVWAACDLAALYIAWRTDRLTDVVIEAGSPAARLVAHHRGVLQLCYEAAHMDLSLYGGEDIAGSLKLRTASTRVAIILGSRYEDQVDSFETLIRALSLDNLRSLTIDGVLLAVLLERPPHRLTQLTLTVRRDDDGGYPWKSPPAMQTDLPELQTLCLDVQPPVDAGDGPQLLTVLASLCATFPALTLDARGIPQCIVDELRFAEELRDRVVFYV